MKMISKQNHCTKLFTIVLACVENSICVCYSISDNNCCQRISTCTGLANSNSKCMTSVVLQFRGNGAQLHELSFDKHFSLCKMTNFSSRSPQYSVLQLLSSTQLLQLHQAELWNYDFMFRDVFLKFVFCSESFTTYYT